MIRMKKKKNRYRIVPTTREGFGSCWALKEGDVVLGTFVSKQHAENRILQLERNSIEEFLLVSTKNQELEIDL